MRDVTFAIIMALGILALCMCIAQALMDVQEAHAQLRNAYYPFSVETAVHDR